MGMVPQPPEGVRETTEVDIPVRGTVPRPPRTIITFHRNSEEFEDST